MGWFVSLVIVWAKAPLCGVDKNEMNNPRFKRPRLKF